MFGKQIYISPAQRSELVLVQPMDNMGKFWCLSQPSMDCFGLQGIHKLWCCFTPLDVYQSFNWATGL